MRIGIISDTHDQVARTRAAVHRLADSGARALIHCGDITIPDVVYELAPLPSHFVFGNCDFDLAELTARRPDYLFSGHTHQALDVLRDDTRFINPGALHRASRWTVGLLDLASGRLEQLTIGAP